MPEDLEYLWAVFVELSNSRGVGQTGAESITLSNIYNWSQLKRVVLSPWEIDTIIRLDHLWLKILGRPSTTGNKNPKR
jgi:hypothetical protein